MKQLLSFLCFATCSYFLSGQVTYYGQIEAVIRRHCTSCHQPKGAAPFPLLTYEDVSKRAKFIQHVTGSRYMPPWKANPHYRSFANEKLLSEEEIRLIAEWVETGSQKGKRIKKKEAKEVTPFIQGRKPDLVLKMREPFIIPGNNKQTYICYKIPYELPNDTFVRGIDFIPGNHRLVHHASYQVLAVPDDVDLYGSPDYFVYGDSDYVNDEHDYNVFNLIKEGRMPVETYHGGWLPGSSMQVYPEGIGFHLPKRGIFMIRNLHYAPSPVEEEDRSEVHLYFSEAPVERQVLFRAFAPVNPDPGEEWIIPADSIKKFHINVNVGADLSLLSINPHMHWLGKYFIAYAIPPSGDTIPLIEIRDWDFNWQEFYRFKRPVHIPKGSFLKAEAIYDNTERNGNNPFHPPRNVYFERGMDDKDEMMRLVFLFLPYRKGDEEIPMNDLSR